jgi:hypothetical protein
LFSFLVKSADLAGLIRNTTARIPTDTADAYIHC